MKLFAEICFFCALTPELSRTAARHGLNELLGASPYGLPSDSKYLKSSPA